MMYTKNKQSKLNKKSLIVIITTLAVIAVSSFVVWYFVFRAPNLEEKNRNETSHVDETSSIKEGQAQGESSDNGNLPSKTGSGDESDVDTSAPTPQSPPEKPQIQRASGSPTLRVVVTFQETSDGYCELVLTNGDSTQTRKASITVSSSYYTCNFDIARDSLQPQDGWSIVVVHHIGEAKTSSDVVELR